MLRCIFITNKYYSCEESFRMPIYEFRCNDCQHINEFVMKISEKKPEEGCESCKSHNMSKIISKSNFVLKGTGWYETDFKDQKNKNKNKTPEKKTNTKEKNSTSNQSASSTTKKAPSTLTKKASKAS